MASARDKEKKAARRNANREWAESEKSGWEPTAVKLPEDVEYYEQKEGHNEFDIIGYNVKRGSDKKGGNPKSASGFAYCGRRYEVHRIPGTGKFEDHYVCLKCFGEDKCPGCEWMLEHGKSADEDLVNKIRLQRRHLWVVNDKPGRSKNKPKVFNSNHFNRKLGFGEQLGDDSPNFWDLKDGRTISFSVKGKYKHVTRVDFKTRDYEYDESILDHGIDLDACLINAGYDKMAAALSGASVSSDDDDGDSFSSNRNRKPRDDDDDDDDKPAAKKKPARDDDDDDDGDEKTAEDLGIESGDKVTYKKKEWTVIKISSDGTSLTLEDDDDKNVKASPSAVKKIEDDPDDDDDDDDKPAAKKPAKKKPADDDDDGDDDDNPPAKKKKKPVDDDDDPDDDDNPPAKKKNKPADEDDDPDDDDDDDDDDDSAIEPDEDDD